MANTFETSQFGDGVSTTRATNVSNHYGGRETGGAKGVVKTEGAMKEASITISGTNLSDGTFDLLTDLKIPAGAMIEDVYLKVSEAFVLTGTSPTLLIGTATSEVTNGFVGSEAQMEAAGSYDLTSTLTGTWAAPLAASTTVGISLGGTGGPTSSSAGKAKVIVRYAVVGAV